jgi:PAB1-binding protein PBP1
MRCLELTRIGASSFLTDTDISGNRTLRERTLQRWEPSAETDVDLSLEGSSSATGGWDQFETNQRLYGVQSDYDPDFYTTAINSNRPNFARAAAEAERLAREIERGSSSNPHVREERGLAAENDANGLDEESK